MLIVNSRQQLGFIAMFAHLLYKIQWFSSFFGHKITYASRLLWDDWHCAVTSFR